jgi:putative membrane protein
MWRVGHIGGFGFEWIFMIIFWILIIWAILAIFRSMGRHGEHWHMREKEDSAMEILRQRYAKGEINKEEFQQRQKDLMGTKQQ